MKRFLWLGFVLVLYVICSGCGDTFRPIIIPNPPTFPNPRAAHTVVSINDNGGVVAGSAMVIDVSGDTDVSVKDVGLAPVHAVQQTANQVLVVNHSVTGPLNTGDSLTKLNFNGTVISSATTISLPPNSAPNFVAVAPSDTTAYVTLPNLNAVAVVNTVSNSQVTIQVGSNPVALAVTPDKSKLYVANQGDNTVSGFNTIGRSMRPLDLNGFSPFSAPLWVIARSDSQRVYVLNGSGVVSTIDTTSTAGPDIVIDASISAPGAAYMLYDVNKNRLYIPGGRSTQLTILDVSQSSPQPLGGGPIGIPTVAPSSRPASDVCSLTSTQPLIVAAVAALPDGSRAYVGSYYEDAVNNVNYICPQVTVIDVASNTIKSYFAVPGFPAYDALCFPSIVSPRVRFRLTMAAGGDSTRAYLASCDGGMVNIIDTTNDTYILNLPAPIGSRPPILPNPQNPPQNPVFLFAGP
jgi:DNA-binding beta-propeller fold protein YncE